MRRLVNTAITLTEILQADSLQKISRTNGENYLLSLVDFFITDLASFFNFARNMTPQQIAQTSGLVIELYPHFKAEDLAKCFKNIKILKYGKLYEGLDGSKILEFLNLYDLERQEEIIQFRIAENSKNKAEINPGEYSEKYINLLKEVEKYVKVDKKEPLPEAVKNNEFMKGIFLEYEKEFDKLHVEQKAKNGMGFVEYKNKKYNFTEYCNLRFNEENN